MFAIAEQIIAQASGPFDPTEFNDRYEDALWALIHDKQPAATKRATAKRAAPR